MVPVECGLRQGCKAAPWLWNSILALILTDLSSLIDRNWLCDHTNLYADDIHAGDTFSSETELMTLLRNFAMILSMLRSYGLQINKHKSMILLTMTGPSQSQVRKKTWSDATAAITWFFLLVTKRSPFLWLTVQNIWAS